MSLGPLGHKNGKMGHESIIFYVRDMDTTNIHVIQYFPKLVSSITLLDSFLNTRCQDLLVYIGSFSGVFLPKRPVLFLHGVTKADGGVY
jgi:hypothetical protein